MAGQTRRHTWGEEIGDFGKEECGREESNVDVVEDLARVSEGDRG